MRHEPLTITHASPISGVEAHDCRIVDHPSALKGYATSYTLPIGAQRRLIDAASFSQEIGAPITTLLTINLKDLQRLKLDGVIVEGHPWECFRRLLELIRKWLTSRGVRWAVIWAREWSKWIYEHWHIAIHLPEGLRRSFADQVAAWTGDAISEEPPEKKGDVARSVSRAWKITADDGRGGPEDIAAYLGKAEPSKVKRYGRWRANQKKPRRRLNGGDGPIAGKRHGICNTLGATAQRRAGWKPDDAP